MNRSPLPSRLIVMDAIGAGLTGIGLAAMFTDLSDLAPILANKQVAGVIVAVGVALMIVAVLKIVQHVRAASSQSPGDRP